MRFKGWIVTTLVIAITQALLSLLLILQHDAIYSELLRQRVAVIAQTTAETFRPILDLGLPISMLRDGDAILARGIAIDPSIVAVHAINPTGIVAHTTGSKPGTIDDNVLTAMRLADQDVWGHETSDLIYSGFSIRPAEGAPPSGAVVVEYPHDKLDAASRNIARTTLRSALVILLATSALAFVLIYLVLDRPRRRLADLRTIFEATRAGQSYDAGLAVAKAGSLNHELLRLGQNLQDADAAFRKLQLAIAQPDGAHLQSEDRSANNDGDEGNLNAGRLKAVIMARLLPITVLLVVISAIMLGTVATRAVTRSIEPELAARTDLIGNVVSENVQRALDSGIALNEIVGADQFFGDMLKRLPEVAYIAVATGRIVIEAGNRIDPYLAPPRERRDVRSHPIVHDGEEVAYVVIDIDPRLITKRFHSVFLDAVVILLVTMLLASEVMLLLAGRALAEGLEQVQRLSAMQAAGNFSRRVIAKGQGTIGIILRTLSERAIVLHASFNEAVEVAGGQRQAALRRIGDRFGLTSGAPRLLESSSFGDIRLALVLFAAADELPLAFLPIYTRAAENLWPWLDQAVLIALPLAGYLLAIVMMSPYARVLVERFGVRRLFVAASIPTAIAHLGLFAAATAQEIIFWRTVTGFGYAIVTLAAQDYVLSVASKSNRDSLLGVFTLVLFGGVFTGVALGGVLADRLGPANVFLVSAGLIAASALLSTWLIAPDVGKRHDPHAIRTVRTKWTALRHPRLIVLILGIVIPSAVVLQAFISYLVALTLDAQGASAAEIGRILMLFFLTLMAVGPLAGRLSQHLKGSHALLCVGAAGVCGVALLPAALHPSQLSMALAMVATGAGSAMIRGAQVSIALLVAETDLAEIGPTAVLGVLRTGERLGSIVGLVLIAGLAGVAGYTAAILAVALWTMTGGVVFGALNFRHLLTRR
ncbi:MFS transporter [Defluviimonas sp. WL0024]|uniref:MFS transporter n=1 Tax=Albidovulum salinarum TaxID=2984153 RepID=A0ABT2XA56_9RHOB|nr:MFS transporter [Defluviimonas sp. WL0024]MCU9850520.1 MFS transporter [Defluviimonas sp. WL0024]